jgi:hypothetical protein
LKIKTLSVIIDTSGFKAYELSEISKIIERNLEMMKEAME